MLELVAMGFAAWLNRAVCNQERGVGKSYQPRLQLCRAQESMFEVDEFPSEFLFVHVKCLCCSSGDSSHALIERERERARER